LFNSNSIGGVFNGEINEVRGPKSFTRNDISMLKMLSNPPEEIVNADMQIICDTHIWIFRGIGLGWGILRETKQEDYINIPQLL